MTIDFAVARYPESTRVVCPWCDYSMDVTTDERNEIRPLAWVTK